MSVNVRRVTLVMLVMSQYASENQPIAQRCAHTEMVPVTTRTNATVDRDSLEKNVRSTPVMALHTQIPQCVPRMENVSQRTNANARMDGLDQNVMSLFVTISQDIRNKCAQEEENVSETIIANVMKDMQVVNVRTLFALENMVMTLVLETETARNQMNVSASKDGLEENVRYLSASISQRQTPPYAPTREPALDPTHVNAKNTTLDHNVPSNSV